MAPCVRAYISPSPPPPTPPSQQVAAAGLPLDFLGRRLSDIHGSLARLAQQHGLHVAGEGGEYVLIA